MFAVALYVCFLDNANKLLQKRFCFTQVSAGRAIMVTYIVAACCSAPLGFVVDRIGFKRYFTIAGMCIFTTAQLIILVYPQCLEGTINNNSFGGASWGLFLLGVGYCFYANCMVPSIPLVVRKKVTGTAFGIMQMIESIALALFPLIAGELVLSAQNE
jgi:MFS family permease